MPERSASHADPLLTTKEAAEYTRVSVQTLAQLRFNRKGPRFLKPTLKTVLYRQSALDEWLDQSERLSTPVSA